MQQENQVAERAQKAMADQATQTQKTVVSKAELKAREEAHQKMLDYRAAQKKEREEQKREKEMVMKDALEAEKAAETLRALEHELPIDETKPKKSGAGARHFFYVAVAIIFGCSV